MLSPLHDWLLKWGMSEAGATLLTRLGGVLLVLFVALIANRVTKSVVVRGIARLARWTTLSWDDVVMRHRVLQRVAHLVPALVIYHFATPVLAGYDQLTAVVRQGALIYMIVIAALAADSVVNVGIEIVRGSRLPRELPVRSIAQVLKLVVYAATAISVLALRPRPLAAAAVERPWRDERRNDADLQGHHSWLRRWHPAVGEPNGLAGRLDRDAEARRRRRRARCGIDDGEGSELGQDDHHDSHLRACAKTRPF